MCNKEPYVQVSSYFILVNIPRAHTYKSALTHVRRHTHSHTHIHTHTHTHTHKHTCTHTTTLNVRLCPINGD